MRHVSQIGFLIQGEVPHGVPPSGVVGMAQDAVMDAWSPVMATGGAGGIRPGAQGAFPLLPLRPPSSEFHVLLHLPSLTQPVTLLPPCLSSGSAPQTPMVVGH